MRQDAVVPFLYTVVRCYLNFGSIVGSQFLLQKNTIFIAKEIK